MAINGGREEETNCPLTKPSTSTAFIFYNTLSKLILNCSFFFGELFQRHLKTPVMGLFSYLSSPNFLLNGIPFLLAKVPPYKSKQYTPFFTFVHFKYLQTFPTKVVNKNYSKREVLKLLYVETFKNKVKLLKKSLFIKKMIFKLDQCVY